jgi:hypothetical protein
MRSIFARDEELASIRAWTSICHTEQSFFGVFNDKVFIFELFSTNGFAPCSISIGKILKYFEISQKVLEGTSYSTPNGINTKQL